jgi:hypothetical protein
MNLFVEVYKEVFHFSANIALIGLVGVLIYIIIGITYNFLSKDKNGFEKFTKRYGALIIFIGVISFFRLGSNCYEHDTSDYYTESETTAVSCDYTNVPLSDFIEEYFIVFFVMFMSYGLIKSLKEE